LVAQARQDEEVLHVGTHVPESDRAPEPPGRELEAGQGVDGNSIEVGETAHLTRDEVDVAPCEQHTHALAEAGDRCPRDRASNVQHDRPRSGRRSEGVDRCSRRLVGCSQHDISLGALSYA
jgi:hypothetical protein